MQYSQDHRHLDGSDRNWRGEADADRIGPQGEALILELQRLRKALDSERGDDRRPAGPSGRGEARKRQAPRKPQPPRARQKPKSTVKLAIDFWMKSFGTKAAVQAEDVSNPLVEPVVSPPHRQSPPIFPSDPIYMDLRKPAPNMRCSNRLTITRGRGPSSRRSLMAATSCLACLIPGTVISHTT